MLRGARHAKRRVVQEAKHLFRHAVRAMVNEHQNEFPGTLAVKEQRYVDRVVFSQNLQGIVRSMIFDDFQLEQEVLEQQEERLQELFTSTVMGLLGSRPELCDSLAEHSVEICLCPIVTLRIRRDEHGDFWLWQDDNVVDERKYLLIM